MAERSHPLLLRFALLVAAAALVVAGAWLFATAPEPESVAPAGEAAAALEVATLRVEQRTVRPRVRRSGVLEARRSVEIFAETRGRVLERGAEELDRVEEGQLLLRLDPLRARVGVERARAAVARVESQLALARAQLARRRSLTQRGVASAAALDDAENAERVAAAALREARATLEEARDQLAKKTIHAPFAGVLRSFPIETGESVRDGQRVAELLDVRAVRITVGLGDREIVSVRVGAPAQVEVEAFAGESFAGRVLRVGAATDPATKKFPVQIEVENPDARLLPGMIARVSLDLGDAGPLTLVPRDATLEEYGLRFVYVLEAGSSDGRWVARRRRIQVRELPFQPASFQVLSGLQPGEEIVLTGLRQLRDGTAVRRKQDAPR